MRPPRAPYLLLSVLISFFLSVSVFAQQANRDPEAKPPGRNIFRTNLTSMAFRNYEFQYERMIARRTSLGLAYRSMPSGPILFKDMILNSMDDTGNPGDVDARQEVESIRMKNYAITPEIRFYAGKKGYGHGFYLSLFFRHASHTIDNISIDYTDNAGANQTVSLTGTLTSNTGGLMIGSQWMIARRVAFDWWILGPHVGTAKGTLAGRSTQAMNTNDQNSLRSELTEALSGLPFFVNNTIQVSSNSASISLSGPWVGLRAGFSLGFRL